MEILTPLIAHWNGQRSSQTEEKKENGPRNVNRRIKVRIILTRTINNKILVVCRYETVEWF